MVSRIRLRMALFLVLANVVGVAIVVVCILWVVPGPPIEDVGRTVALNGILVGFFFVVIVPIMSLLGEKWLASGRQWLIEGRVPTDREVTAALRGPIYLYTVHVGAWFVAAVVFAILNGILDVDMLPRVSITILLGGLTTSAVVYLLAERETRPIAALALSLHAVDEPKLPGVVTRTMIAWAFGSGVPFLGLLITGILTLIRPRTTVEEVAVTLVVVSGLGLIAGALVTVNGARAVADPVRDLQRAIGELSAGDLDARAQVFDGSVLGVLQAGFNDMAAGIAERERLRDLYGRQVGEEVARESLERGSSLGGEVTDVAVLFVDVVGSTGLAATLPATEVVGLLNRFFGVVVDEVHGHGGWINKFQGDATLAVFGAPSTIEDPAGKALAAARCISKRLPIEVPQLGAGVGVSFGSVVAGNVGDERRFEFTVIGDPVNEAARLTELSKTFTPMVLASAASLDAAGQPERRHWELNGEVELRGRDTPTRLATPLS
ncbi:MAG: adenylate/guanylate cyclase domain-containing protein [Acidimicrobiales bacterium]|nr:adenylate/guanylate cyclase domain-containing protein [Acidimicrobiales bacterium]